jgi:betaine-aldehyde dehydrogenase
MSVTAHTVVVPERLCLIGGERVPAISGRWTDSVNPATGETVVRVPRCDQRDADAAAAAAKKAFPAWRATDPMERARLVRAFADAIEERADELAMVDSIDNGSPLREMRRDVSIAVATLRYMAGLVLETRGETMPETAGRLHFTTREPFGIVARIVAFNHPLMFAASKMAAPLLAGNAVIIKPAGHTSLSSLAMADDLQRIFPPGVVQIVTGSGSEVGDALVRHPDIRRIAFIGSGATGRSIQAAAAETAVKTITLELGGKNPIAIFPDADLDLAVEGIVRGMNFTWQGQSCSSTSRVLIHEDCYDEVVERVAAKMAAIKVGLPADPETQSGAIVNAQQLNTVLSYIEIGKSEGARLVTGGTRLTDGELAAGNFIPPTLFADVDPTSRLANEEIFGPVLAAIRFRDYDEAIRIANRVNYGLTASVFTRDLATAMAYARDVEAGYVWVNDSSTHFLGAPYGGYKESGIGRDEDLAEIASYTQVKSVHVRFA